LAESEQRLPRWYLLLVIAAAGLAIGFGSGAWLTLRARSALQHELAAQREQVRALQRDVAGQTRRASEAEDGRAAAESRAETLHDELIAARAYAEGLEKGMADGADARTGDATTNSSAVEVLAGRPAVTSAPATDAEPGRCTAITKAGTRCKRKAEAGSDRCWQHKRQS
jgi:hypothetical protein